MPATPRSERSTQNRVVAPFTNTIPQTVAVARGAGTTAPDVHAEWTVRSETDFRLWLRDQPIPTIRAVIRAQDLDPARRTSKRKDAEKLADFVAEGLRARLSRGSAFIGTTRREE